MTKAEIFIQILSEVTGKPKGETSEIVNAYRQQNPGKWDVEVSAQQKEQLLTGFRAEAPGILAWFVRFSMDQHQRQGQDNQAP